MNCKGKTHGGFLPNREGSPSVDFRSKSSMLPYVASGNRLHLLHSGFPSTRFSNVVMCFCSQTKFLEHPEETADSSHNVVMSLRRAKNGPVLRKHTSEATAIGSHCLSPSILSHSTLPHVRFTTSRRFSEESASMAKVQLQTKPLCHWATKSGPMQSAT